MPYRIDLTHREYLDLVPALAGASGAYAALADQNATQRDYWLAKATELRALADMVSARAEWVYATPIPPAVAADVAREVIAEGAQGVTREERGDLLEDPYTGSIEG